MYTVFCLHVYCTPEEGVWMVVSHHVIARNWTQDLWKTSQGS